MKTIRYRVEHGRLSRRRSCWKNVLTWALQCTTKSLRDALKARAHHKSEWEIWLKSRGHVGPVKLKWRIVKVTTVSKVVK